MNSHTVQNAPPDVVYALRDQLAKAKSPDDLDADARTIFDEAEKHTKAVIHVGGYERDGQQVKPYVQTRRVRKIEHIEWQIENVGIVRDRLAASDAMPEESDVRMVGRMVRDILSADVGLKSGKTKVAKAAADAEAKQVRLARIKAIIESKWDGQRAIREQNPGMEQADLRPLFYEAGVGDGQVISDLLDNHLTDAERANEDFWHTAPDGTRHFDVSKFQRYLDDEAGLAQRTASYAATKGSQAHIRALTRTMRKVRPNYGTRSVTAKGVRVIPASAEIDKRTPEEQEADLTDAVAGVKAVGLMLPAEWVARSESTGSTYVKTTPHNTAEYSWGRAHHQWHPGSEPSRGYSEIVTTPGRLATALHEYMHRMQEVHPVLHEVEREFWKRRTKGEPISALFDGKDLGFGVEETRSDHFIDPYMGKIYAEGDGDGTTAVPSLFRITNYEPKEIITRGMEEIWLPNNGGVGDIYEKDPEYADLILGMMAAL